MTVRTRLEAADVADLDAHEAALRSVLTIPAAGSRDYPNRRDPGRRRYLESTGTRPTRAGRTAAPAGPSPPAAAGDAKRRRDLADEIAVLQAADEALARQPWFPLQPGDVVLMHLPADQHSPAYGETYLAVDDDTDVAGNALLRTVNRTRLPQPAGPKPEYLLRHDGASGCWALDSRDLDDSLAPWIDARELACADPPPGAERTPFYDLWFEAGPHQLVVIRAGAVVHGTPATATTAPARMTKPTTPLGRS